MSTLENHNFAVDKPMTELEIVKVVAELDARIGTLDSPETTTEEPYVCRWLPQRAIISAIALMGEANEPPAPSSIELFEARVAAIRANAFDLREEIDEIERSPLHGGLSAPLVAMREEVANAYHAAQAIEKQIAELKRNTNGRTEVAASGTFDGDLEVVQGHPV